MDYNNRFWKQSFLSYHLFIFYFYIRTIEVGFSFLLFGVVYTSWLGLPLAFLFIYLLFLWCVMLEFELDKGRKWIKW